MDGLSTQRENVVVTVLCGARGGGGVCVVGKVNSGGSDALVTLECRLCTSDAFVDDLFIKFLPKSLASCGQFKALCHG